TEATSTERFRPLVLHTPVYTAMLVNKAADDPKGFYAVITKPDNPQKQFKVLVPTALLDYQRVTIIDDTIITGVTMKALRRDFEERGYETGRVQFACCVCHSGLSALSRIATATAFSIWACLDRRSPAASGALSPAGINLGL